MRVIFTRHGETKENIAGVSMGHDVDGALNETGVEQAKKLSERLRNENFQYIYSSDLKRALDTAKEIAKYHPDAKLVITEQLRERSLGIYEGGPRSVWKEAMSRTNLSFRDFKPEGGESYSELYQRVKSFFDPLVQRHQDDKVLIVAHRGILATLFLKIFNRELEKEEFDRFKPGNTAVTICDILPDKTCEPVLLNCTKHLQS